MSDQGVHGGRTHKMQLTWGLGDFDHPAQRVTHLHGTGAPRFAQSLSARNLVECLHKALVAHCEVLRAMVKPAVGGVACRHATTRVFALFKNADTVSSLDQSSCGGDAGHASTDDGDFFHRSDSTPSRGLCGALRNKALRVGLWLSCFSHHCSALSPAG